MASLSSFPGRSNTAATSPAPSTKTTLTLTTRTLRSPASLDAYNISPTDPTTTRRSSRTSLRKDMASLPSSSPPRGSNKPKSIGHAKLHKRGGSGSSLPGPPSPFTSTFSTPFATYEESPGSVAPTPKIKPYLRKMSSAKEDQGMIDLSKSAAENDRLAGSGLGIHDLSNKTAADVSFAHSRRQPHGRNTSTGSQASTGSGSFRPSPGQPFTHPMAKTPRPYTPPAGASYASSLNEEEVNESDDVVEDEFRLGSGFRARRSVSISSTAQNIPTPLSQSHIAGDLDMAPNLSASHSNLSIRSSRSGKSKKGRPRRNTEMSLLEHNHEQEPSPTSRPSFDKAFSFVSRRSETEPQSRDELIRAARRKFEEKEATKTRKDEKRRERQRSKPDAAEDPRPSFATTDGASEKHRRRKSSVTTAGALREDDGKFHAKSYEDYRPAHAATLPRYGNAPGESEKRQMQQSVEPKRTVSGDGTWMRFSTWLQTRMLSCGGGRR